MRLAIFGGTFDPIHQAHLAMAREAAERFHLDRVLLIPASHPPHKSGLTSAPYEDRFRMVELACENESSLTASDLEKGPGPSYSIDTINKLRASLKPEDRLFFLIGADAFAEIETWHRWREVVAAVEFIVVSRPGHRYRIPEGSCVQRLETVDLPVSSSEIRGSLASGNPPADIPQKVLSYIYQRGLYGVPVRA